MQKKTVFWLIPSVCLIAAALLLGFFLGRNTVSDTVRVQTQRPAAQYVPQPMPHESTIAVVDLNTADVQTLMTLPGVGEVLAGRIADYRALAGGFVAAEQLLEVEGIGETTFEQLRAFIKVEGSYEDPGR